MRLLHLARIMRESWRV
jgi:hypothetical protein